MDLGTVNYHTVTKGAMKFRELPMNEDPENLFFVEKDHKYKDDW